jgi:proton-coupled amino acid transporter
MLQLQVLLFEGTITLLVPLQEAVVLEEERAKFPAVFQRVILSIISFYMFFGLINWAAYGQEVRTVLTTCLPPGVLATTVQLAYSVAVIFTFPLQNFPALEIATRSIATSVAKCTKPGSIWTKRNVLSSLLVALLAIVALATMDSLDKVVSLMGSLLGCPIAFIFPPLIQIQLMPEISATRRGCNYFVMFMGVVAMVLASVTTILTW